MLFGYIFQNYCLIENDTVKENLLLSKKYRKNFKEKELEESLEKVGISKEYLGHKVCELSGGEQQRIAIARTMLKPCEIILADEPTGNLDTSNKEKIIHLFKELKKEGKTIICVTHDEEMAKSADRIIDLKKKEGRRKMKGILIGQLMNDSINSYLQCLVHKIIFRILGLGYDSLVVYWGLFVLIFFILDVILNFFFLKDKSR